MAKSTFEERISNRELAHKASQRALEMAKTRLRHEGINYPEYNSSKSALENHDALEAYRAIESKYYMQYLKEPSGPRPLVPPKQDWMSNYD